MGDPAASAKLVPEQPGQRLSLLTALKDLGWFFGVFTALVGGPSIIQIVQYTVPTFRLSSFLAWLPDGLHRLQLFVAGLLGPSLTAFVEWINEGLGLDLHLSPVWLPIFSLSWVYVAARARISWQLIWWRTAVPQSVAATIGALFAAVLVGVAASVDAWWVQGLAAGLPLLLIDMFSAFGLIIALLGIPTLEHYRSLGRSFLFSLRDAVVGFLLGAAAYVVFRASGGIVALGLLVLFRGLQSISIGRGDAVPYNMRVGLTVVGAFVAAAIIAGADAVLNAMG